MNRIIESGLPLFFPVAEPDKTGIAPPENRRGEAVSTWIRSLSGMQKEALVASRRTGTVWRLVSDEGEYLNGYDAAPCPLAFLTSGMAASYMTEIQALAKMQNIEIRHIRLTQDNFYTMEGSVLDGTMIGGALPVELSFEIDCDLKGPELLDFLYKGVSASPLNGLMRGQLTSLFALSRNGLELKPNKVAPLSRPIYPDPGDHFNDSTPDKMDDTFSLVQKTGTSPKIEGEVLTAGKGSSLMASQSRKLHVRGECTLRPDGIKEIEQFLFRPRGSILKFLSEEAPANGGQGRAPDANTLIPAGIGFCFMTQFGRFASILKKDLRSYRIIQDTHFSLGGASGETGKAGAADAVETHVFLDTGEDEEFARDILDVAERTCFLHAFCRTDLKPKIRIVS